MKKTLRFPLVLILAIAFGYFFRGAFGREAAYWLIGGLVGLVIVLKGVQIVLQRYLKAREAKMSPKERQEFEKFKKEQR